jgi:hypothetical protein
MEDQNFDKQVTMTIKKHVVVYGKHEYILTNVQNLLDKAGFTSVGFTVLAETLDYIRMNPLDAVLIGGGVEPIDRARIKDLIREDFAHAKVIEHFGGPATILNEVKAAIGE